MNKRVLIIIPAYNEEGNIERVVEDLEKTTLNMITFMNRTSGEK